MSELSTTVLAVKTGLGGKVIARAEEMISLTSFCLVFDLWLIKMRFFSAYAVSFIFSISPFY